MHWRSARASSPGRVEATWHAGQTVTFNRVPGERNPGTRFVACTLTREDGEPEPRSRLLVGEPLTPDFTGSATVTCDQPVALLTGSARVVAEYTRGPLVALPLFAAAIGVLYFFPRFTMAWAANPFRRLFGRSGAPGP